MPKISGRCLCGSVSYTSTADSPAMVAACHCTHCQRQSGTAFSMNVAVPADSLSCDGDSLATYQDTGSSGMPVLRSFCSKCGSPLFSDVKAIPGLLFLKAATLDDASWVKPAAAIWGRSKQPWASLEGVPEFAQNPPRA
ncbi:MAG: GFA family protein [Burkholderiaceae bacterium]|nr:GFA family protein [Burkholderiaceae bacterium]